jgi:glycosyltransferase involved in cell wall biosynthesis
VQDYYKQRYGAESSMIGYGAQPMPNSNHFGELGLNARRYILYVARLEPENNPELVLCAYKDLQTDWPLVVVGGNPYQSAYVEHLKRVADDRVIFTGPVYGHSYWSLQNNAGAVIFAGEIGGIHPAFVEALAAGNAVLYLDNAANRETASGCGIPFCHNPQDLSTKLRDLLACPERIEQMRAQAAHTARQVYDWEQVAEQYERLFISLRQRSR